MSATNSTRNTESALPQMENLKWSFAIAQVMSLSSTFPDCKLSLLRLLPRSQPGFWIQVANTFCPLEWIKMASSSQRTPSISLLTTASRIPDKDSIGFARIILSALSLSPPPHFRAHIPVAELFRTGVGAWSYSGLLHHCHSGWNSLQERDQESWWLIWSCCSEWFLWEGILVSTKLRLMLYTTGSDVFQSLEIQEQSGGGASLTNLNTEIKFPAAKERSVRHLFPWLGLPRLLLMKRAALWAALQLSN